LDDPEIVDRLSTGARSFPLLRRAQTSSGVLLLLFLLSAYLKLVPWGKICWNQKIKFASIYCHIL